jgi:hypothetical protein
MAERLSELLYRVSTFGKAFRGDAFSVLTALVADGAVSEKALAAFEQQADELMLELSNLITDVRNFANEVGVVKTEEDNHE